MAKKNFDAFINSAGKKPKPTPDEVEAMAKQLHNAANTAAVQPPGSMPTAPKPTKPTPAVEQKPPQADADAPAAAKRQPKAESRQAPTASRQPVAPPPKEKVRITIDLAKDLYKRMKLAVVQNDTEISAYVRQLIENDLSQK